MEVLIQEKLIEISASILLTLNVLNGNVISKVFRQSCQKIYRLTLSKNPGKCTVMVSENKQQNM